MSRRVENRGDRIAFEGEVIQMTVPTRAELMAAESKIGGQNNQIALLLIAVPVALSIIILAIKAVLDKADERKKLRMRERARASISSNSAGEVISDFVLDELFSNQAALETLLNKERMGKMQFGEDYRIEVKYKSGSGRKAKMEIDTHMTKLLNIYRENHAVVKDILGL